MEKPRKSVFPVGIGAKGQNTAKYQFSNGGGTTQETSFSGRIGKESAGK